MTKTETARTYFVAGDTCEWETFTTLGAARRRAELLWHRDVIAFPATIPTTIPACTMIMTVKAPRKRPPR